MAAAAGAALTAAHRVIDRVHGDTADVGTRPFQRARPAFPMRLVLVLQVADLADRGHGSDVDHAHLAARQTQRGVAALARHQLGAGSGGAHHLAALARLQLDGVEDRAEGDVRESGSMFPGADLGVRTGHQHVAHLQAVGREDVALLAVGVVEQRDVGGAVRVVLDRRRPSPARRPCRGGSRSCGSGACGHPHRAARP